MPGLSHLPLALCITGCLLCSSLAWHVQMPHHIVALKDSCLVIPCSFDYYQYPPTRPNRVVWYQYVSRGYPLVYDDWYPNDVISIFRKKTHVSTYGKKCTLRIYPVTWSHHRQKIYPWVDPENVGRSTYAFYETTVTIEVADRAQKPDLMITGEMKVGKKVTVECSVSHTCSTNPPTLSLNVPLINHALVHHMLTDGTSRTTLTTVMFVERDQQTVECVVRHYGGKTEKAFQTLNAECSFSPLLLKSTTEEFLEGIPSKVTCTASYTCSHTIPSLTWNYGSMQTSTDITSSGKAIWKTVSTLMFVASAQDQGKSLTCYALFSGGKRLEVSIPLQVKRNMLSRGWSFSTPSTVTGMAGSCIVIPCKFTYTKSQPADLKVLWYLYDGKGYPPVYNAEQSVHSKFSRRTSLIGSVKDGNCSLKIERLVSQSQDRVYPWVDKNPIASYHTIDHSFYDKTTQIIVSDHVKEPQISIIGIPKVGAQSRISCTVQHACIFDPPSLTITGVHGADDTKHTMLSDGVWETRVERAWTVSEDNQSVMCTVSHPGGQKATSETKIDIECPHEDITMVEKPGNLTEGVATSVVCSVSYKCKKNTPNIVWNFNNMQSALNTKLISGNTYKTISNLTFIGSLVDDGKSLTCTAQFVAGETSDSVTLRITRYEKPEYTLERDILPADVPFRVSALTRSCVVIPCSFQNHEDSFFTRGIWSKKAGGNVYHNGRSNVLDHFKDRTQIVGDLNEGDCSLEIDDIKPFDNGPFCFSAEKGSARYRFNNSCAFVVMKASPEKPVMTSVPTEAEAGSVLTVACSVTHTCHTHPPVFLWNVANLTNEVVHTSTKRGVWETTSNISFSVPAGDGPSSVTCTASFWGNKQESSTAILNVKASLIYQMRSSLPVVVPVSLIIVALVFGVVIYKKRGNSNDSLRPPPRPEKRRYPEATKKPPRPEKRQNTEDFSVHYVNNSTAVISEPRSLLPKNERRPPRPERANTEQLY